MKKYIFILKKFGSVALLCSIVLAMSCTDDYDDINTNKNKISVLEPSQLPFLFSKVQSTATNNGVELSDRAEPFSRPVLSVLCEYNDLFSF